MRLFVDANRMFPQETNSGQEYKDTTAITRDEVEQFEITG